MKILSFASHAIVSLLSQFSNGGLLYKFCCRVVDYHEGDNLDDMMRNGECRVIETLVNPELGPMFDVGANRGDWIQAVIQRHPSVRVHCFEPSTYAFGLLQDRLSGFKVLVQHQYPGHSRNQGVAQRVVLNNFGFGAKEQILELHCYEAGGGTNSFIERDLSAYGVFSKQKEHARIITIDQYCVEHNIKVIGFLKIDTEGFELEVLRGAERMLLDGRIRIIQFEYGGTYLDAGIFLKDLFKLFERFSYGVYKITPSRLIRLPRYDPRLDHFKYGNFLASREDLGQPW